MRTVNIEPGGTLVLAEDVLLHLGVVAGKALDLLLLPGGRVELRATRRIPLEEQGEFSGVALGDAD